MDYRSLLLLTFSWQSSKNYYLRSSERLSCPTLHLPAAGAAMTPENPTHVLPTTSPLTGGIHRLAKRMYGKKALPVNRQKMEPAMMTMTLSLKAPCLRGTAETKLS